MSSKNQQINDLFQRWEEHVPEYRSHFVKDGIIDENLFEQSYPKILFITKEPNNPKQEADDFRIWWETELKYAFSLRISEWTYGILNKFPPYDIIKRSNSDRLNAIHHIAFMNVKKIGGGSQSEYDNIINSVNRDFDFIHKQIEIINPDIIILGLSWKEVRTELFPDLNDKWQESGYDIAIARFNNAKVIDFYHPSSRNAPAASYSLLQNVVNSQEFNKL